MIPDDAGTAMGGLALVLGGILGIVRLWDIALYLLSR